MQRFESPLRIDNVLFVAALTITGTLLVTLYRSDEREKTAIAEASALRKGTLARAQPTCAPDNAALSRSDATDACAPAPGQPR